MKFHFWHLLGVLFIALRVHADIVPVACDKSAAEWRQYQQTAVQESLWDGKASQHARFLKTCLPRANKRIRSCMQRVNELVQLLKSYRESSLTLDEDLQSLGTHISDREYFEKTKAYTEPHKELANSTFLNLLKASEPDLQKIEEYFAALNKKRKKKNLQPIEWVNYVSTQPSNDGRSIYDRILIYHPGDKKREGNIEQWLQFPPGGKIANVIGVVEQKDGSHKSYFKDVQLARKGFVGQPNPMTEVYIDKKAHEEKVRTYTKADAVIHFPMENIGSDSCVRCHLAGGPLPIYPATPQANDAQKKALATMNERIASYGATFGEFDAKRPKEWPMIGSGAELTPEMLAFCAEFLWEEQVSEQGEKHTKKSKERFYEKVQNAMRCTDCHDDSTRVGLRPPIRKRDPGLLELIRRGKMPPHNNLSQNERWAVSQCLMAQYFGFKDENKSTNAPGELLQYLQEQRCEPPKASPPTERKQQRQINH